MCNAILYLISKWKILDVRPGFKAPTTIMYASIVSREPVRIALMIAALNNLEVKLGNILNAYVQAPVTEKVWTTLGPEFGKDARNCSDC